MKTDSKAIVAVVSAFVTISFGMLLFTKGFLLKRVELYDHSDCRSPFMRNILAKNSDADADNCWLRKRFDRSIILIIDALRFDFILPHENRKEYYLNKLNVISSLQKSQPLQVATYRFVADPPTTTMQRLKGLTSGSLPTFVDAGANFASSEIRSDNIISQFAKQQKRLVFMGDDTWTGLFPNKFSQAHPFPSLNVKDLDTVDDGILSLLVPEIQRNEFDVLIAHFLGVDHCGHTFGPDHPRMEAKLRQMNEMIE